MENVNCAGDALELKIAAQCMANLATGGDRPAAAVWEAAFPAAWQRLLTVDAGAVDLAEVADGVRHGDAVMPSAYASKSYRWTI